MDKSETIAVIRSLLSSSKTTYSVNRLNAEFKNETGIDIPLFGYATVGDFLCSIPDTVKVTGLFPIQKVSLVTSEKSAHIVSLVERQKTPQVKRRPFKYGQQRLFSEDNRLEKYFKQKTPVQEGAGCSFQEEGAVAQESGSSLATPVPISAHSSPSSSAADKLVSQTDYLGPGETVPHINVETLAQVGGYVEVHPCHILNPHKFYFHFRKFRKKFSDFMAELQTFYTTQNIPRVPEELIAPKLVCAASYEMRTRSIWHRVEVQEIVNGSKVLVQLIDHGEVLEMPRANIKYLHREFSSFPRQAYLGFLANIRPPKGSPDWLPGAVRRFYDLSFGQDLVAGVVHINHKECRLKVALSCTKDEEIHVNDTLVQEGFAEFDPGVSEQSERQQSSEGSHRTERSTEGREMASGVTEERSVTLPESETPVFFYPDDCSNRRLKKLFSSGGRK